LNTLFWILAALLVLLALLLLLPPLLKKRDVLAEDDHQQRNISIARQRLAELNRQQQNGELSQSLFDEQYLELQLMLNDDLQTAAEQPRPMTGQGRWVAALVGLLLPLLSIALYAQLGDLNAVDKIEQQQADKQSVAKVDALIIKLKEHLQQQPEDLEGWTMLGRSYSYLQQYQNAADIYAQLYRRKPDDAEIILQYANNLGMARNGDMTGEPAQLIFKAVQLAPDNANILWLAGLAKAEEGSSREAAAYWQKLAGLLPANSEALQQVQKMLKSLDVDADNSSRPAAEKVDINIQAAIEPTLKAKMDPQATVFIYAQAVNGPKMPLAIVRKTLSDLPAKVVLNDSMAMQGATRLSEHQTLKIIARVSRSGDAMPQAGDLIGSTEITQPFAQQLVNVLINQEVK